MEDAQPYVNAAGEYMAGGLATRIQRLFAHDVPVPVPTGARAKAWCLLIDAEESLLFMVYLYTTAPPAA